MNSVLWFSLPVACAAVLLFYGYRRWARQQRDLQMFRDRIMFGTSTGNSGEWKRGRRQQQDPRGAVIRENWIAR